MADALNIARTGLDISQQAIDIIAQNASNARSIAYKQRMLVTSDSFYTTLKKGGLPDSASGFASPTPVQRGSGAKVVGVTKIMTQGPKKDTNNPFDLYINGGGYFAVNLADNRVGYTRIGQFKLSNTRQLLTQEGYPLADDITIPTNIQLSDVNISPNGLITNTITGDTIGQITLSTFLNEQGLEDIGMGVSLPTEASGEANTVGPGSDDSVGKIIQGSLEMSNVSQIEALTGLIDAQRAYELNLKIVAAQSEMMKNTNDTYK
jgi:flagellar basal-body rod protein FlgG